MHHTMITFLLTLDRGAGGYWRTYQAQQLATPESFQANPSLVWEFYSYRREVMHTKVRYMHIQLYKISELLSLL